LCRHNLKSRAFIDAWWLDTVDYNAAFFKSVENSFLILKDWEGEDYALKFLAKLMETSLGSAYAGMGAKRGGGPAEFRRCVGERDASVGLKVSFEDLGQNSFAYRFHTDPFPGLKGKVDARRLDAAYMKFKVAYLLGPEWSYSTPKHLWEGSAFTEHVIAKK